MTATGRAHRDGTVVATWNSQYEILEAPRGCDGKRRKWLPCDGCGRMYSAPMRVVGGLCSGACPSLIDDEEAPR